MCEAQRKIVNDERDVIVFLESSDERAEEINLGLRAEAERVAKWLDGEVAEIVSDPFEHPDNSLAQKVKTVLKDIPFRLLLFAHTDQGRMLAPMVAFHFGTPAVIDCRDIRFSDGVLHFVRNVYGDQFEQEVFFRSFPEIAALNLESLKARESASTMFSSARKIRLELPADKPETRTIETIPPDFRTVDLRYAKRILDIGFGCAQTGLLETAQELADLLEASVGTTRPMVDDGHWPKARMIGQTGKTTAPDLCVTLGVSGSPHHSAGLQKSGTVLSVNSDARAPIFDISNTGFVSDLNEMLPKLIRRIKRYRDKGLK
jgi:electron transfer flavoprotein alpha subunit